MYHNPEFVWLKSVERPLHLFEFSEDHKDMYNLYINITFIVDSQVTFQFINKKDNETDLVYLCEYTCRRRDP